ncbi:hypothetical protein PR048_007487 [Dryococelus australis]|uniref:Uncharacterized protein n=1 Tax=Dryococelus australis TaxID=614101 RepID=A0ABQ9HUD3_9NEOP|nr:hypothetical protein PR048_007487 [Dryococelus australis]
MVSTARKFFGIYSSTVHFLLGGAADSVVACHQGGTCLIPVGVATGFSHVGIVSVDAASRRVFSGSLVYLRPFIPAVFNTRFSSPTSALKTSMLTRQNLSTLLLNCFIVNSFVLCEERNYVYACAVARRPRKPSRILDKSVEGNLRECECGSRLALEKASTLRGARSSSQDRRVRGPVSRFWDPHSPPPPPSCIILPVSHTHFPRTPLDANDYSRVPGSIQGGVDPGFFARGNRAGQCRSSAGFLRDLLFSPAIAFPRRSVLASHSSGLKISLLGVSLSCASEPIEHCTPVQSLARSGDGALDARGNIALISPAHLGFKRGINVQVGHEVGVGTRGGDWNVETWRWSNGEITCSETGLPGKRKPWPMITRAALPRYEYSCQPRWESSRSEASSLTTSPPRALLANLLSALLIMLLVHISFETLPLIHPSTYTPTAVPEACCEMYSLTFTISKVQHIPSCAERKSLYHEAALRPKLCSSPLGRVKRRVQSPSPVHRRSACRVTNRPPRDIDACRDKGMIRTDATPVLIYRMPGYSHTTPRSPDYRLSKRGPESRLQLGSPWWEASRLTAEPPRPPILWLVSGAAVVRLLASHQGKPGSIPGKVRPVLSRVRKRGGRCRCSACCSILTSAPFVEHLVKPASRRGDEIDRIYTIIVVVLVWWKLVCVGGQRKCASPQHVVVEERFAREQRSKHVRAGNGSLPLAGVGQTWTRQLLVSSGLEPSSLPSRQPQGGPAGSLPTAVSPTYSLSTRYCRLGHVVHVSHKRIQSHPSQIPLSKAMRRHVRPDLHRNDRLPRCQIMSVSAARQINLIEGRSGVWDHIVTRSLFCAARASGRGHSSIDKIADGQSQGMFDWQARDEPRRTYLVTKACPRLTFLLMSSLGYKQIGAWHLPRAAIRLSELTPLWTLLIRAQTPSPQHDSWSQEPSGPGRLGYTG